jgi:hypothetical protein
MEMFSISSASAIELLSMGSVITLLLASCQHHLCKISLFPPEIKLMDNANV